MWSFVLTEEAGAEAVVKRLMNKVGLTDEVVRSEKVWVVMRWNAYSGWQHDVRSGRRRERNERLAFGDLLAGSPHSPLSAWLSPKNGTPSEQSWTPKASRSPKRLAFLEPESSSIQILQAPSRRVRKLSEPVVCDYSCHCTMFMTRLENWSCAEARGVFYLAGW
eukprot:g9660.t1